MNYNLQPYDDSGETTGERTISWFRETFGEDIQKFMPEKRFIAADVGCGNGRFNQIIRELGFKNCYCIDPKVDIDHRFLYNKFHFHKMYLHEFANYFSFKVDVAFLFGSFHILKQIYREGLYSFLKDVAYRAVCLMDVSDLEDFERLISVKYESVTKGRTVLTSVVLDGER